MDKSLEMKSMLPKDVPRSNGAAHKSPTGILACCACLFPCCYPSPWTCKRCCGSCGAKVYWCCWSLCCCFLALLLTILSFVGFYGLVILPMVAKQHPFVYDTDGNKIDAHGGQIVRHEGKFYWYGEAKKGLSADGWPVGVEQGWTNPGVTCYWSDDMIQWHNAGLVFANTSVVLAEDEPGPYVIERPKVIFNEATGLSARRGGRFSPARRQPRLWSRPAG